MIRIYVMKSRNAILGDDQMIALQVRGGPEPYMVSSWIQILRVRSTDAGIYSCTVVSKKGIVRAEATVQVIKVSTTQIMLIEAIQLEMVNYFEKKRELKLGRRRRRLPQQRDP